LIEVDLVGEAAQAMGMGVAGEKPKESERE
jgi:hypothetical protein